MRTNGKEPRIMPLIKVETSAVVPENRRTPVLAACSKVLAETTGKPEQYCMAVLESGAILMAGKPATAAYIDIRGIGGLTPAVNKALAKALCALLQKELGIAPGDIYITFTDVPATNWGYNGGTFG
jgi:phenylpyruvate tautomerase PptA (4-oxalocrotonate tautomerase family)